MLVRLAVYAPNGARQGVLAHPLTLEAAHPLGDVPSLRISYSAHGPGAELLDEPCEIALEYSADGGVSWAEPYDGRFVRIRRRADAADRSGARAAELPGYAWMLRKVILYPGSAPLVSGKRAFLSATPGAIMATVLAEGQFRGALPGLAYDFTPAHDSAGAAWPQILTIYYQPGIDALTALINMSEQGLIDWRMSGRTLQLYAADTTLGRDLAAGDGPVDLRLGRDVLAAPDEATLEDAASAVLVLGEGAFVHQQTSPTPGPWGRWEQYVAAGGVSDVGTATLLATSALTRADGERVQRTRQITTRTARWLPYRDYRPGDYVLAPGEAGHATPLRIRQITLWRDAAGVVGGALTLNDRFLEHQIRLARRTAGIVGGSTIDGGTGARPAPEAPEPRTPAAPTGLTVGAVAYIDAGGFPAGQITASWSPVTADAGGVALTVGGYELWWALNATGAPWTLLTSTTAPDTTATYSPLTVGESYQFKVRAINLGKAGGFSPPQAVTIPDDTTPPPVPSAPVLSTRLGVIHVEWDGLGAGAVPMPADLHRVRVWMQDPLAPGYAEVGSLTSAGSIVVPDQPYGASRQFRLTAIDRSNNESAASATATIATQAVVNTDVIGEVLDAAKLIDGTLVASDKVVAASITGGLIQSLAINTGHLAANAVTAAKIAAGQIQTSHLQANAVTADKLQAVLTLSTRIVAGNPTGARVELSTTGLEAYNASSVQTLSISATTGAVSIIGQLSSGTTGTRVVINPAGAATPEIRFYPSAGTNFSRIYSDASLFAGEATLIQRSGTNAGSTAETLVQHAAGSWDVWVRHPGTLAFNGGRLSAEQSQAMIGYQTASLVQRLTFLPSSTRHSGTWSTAGSDAGLLMYSMPFNGGIGWTLSWHATMASVPLVVWTADTLASPPSHITVGTCVTNRSTTGVLLLTTSTVAISIQAMAWAWRM
ncbi:fibronectin type III domain-containing protein [Bailinhaonella thermotolerans]|uniref:Fibronectin type III domain-containing protein n=1 Tax=Bailinhaonella thermotolerans TaxID=1070861 RepID=A0A3A4A7Z4_9ACTN|nr:fibronectin type III domain-containing protein [Bailinhaonella thermotolerans]RJL21116.1 fibronectin type III domain-containing protein [Bailinhaonella thermotolerans]